MRRLSTAGVFVVASALLMAACTGMPVSSLERLAESRRLAATMLVQLTKAADASNRAVMADTDEASVAFAAEARQSRDAVGASVDALAPILQSQGYRAETGLLDEVRNRLHEYVALDDRLLGLAVENTNLKAQRLSFGPAQQAADTIRDSLARVRPIREADAWRVEVDVARALSAVREIQVLQAPHIAEADDGAMTRLEERMAASQVAARTALAGLDSRARPESRPQLAGGRAALDRFNALNAEIVVLSRRNSNVRSLALSLGQKRTLTAACEDAVRALQEALEKHDFTATR